MWSMAIVEVEEPGKQRSPLVGVVERPSVGPLVEEGPDHPFGLAVGLRSIGPRKPMTDAELVAGRREGEAAVAAAVVGQDPLDRDAMGGIEAPGSAEEGGGRGRGLIGQFLRVGQPAVVIDRDMDPVPAGPAALVVAGRAPRGGQSAARPSCLVSRWTSSPGRLRS